jgi:glutathione S-transferase
VETISWRFTDEEIIAFSGQGRVPVLVDGDKVLTGSWTIANYLENNTEGASLFGGPAGLALTRFIESWTDNVLLSGLVHLILIDLFACLRENVRAYFRSSREQHLGMTLEAACADRKHRVISFRQKPRSPSQNAENATLSWVERRRTTVIT